MEITEFQNFSKEKDKKELLLDKKNNISLAISLASGLAWKDKVESFHEVIAKELLELFDNNLLDDIKLDKIASDYLFIEIEDKRIFFRKNNLFLNSFTKLDTKTFLMQQLIYKERKYLPQYLTIKEKKEMFEKISEEEKQIINRNYSKQELNQDKYLLNLNEEDTENLIEILTKANYFSLDIYNYLKYISLGKYKVSINDNGTNDIKKLKAIYNNYILELGAMVANKIDEYLKNN